MVDVCLRSVLLGPPLAERRDTTTLDALNVYISSVIELLPQVYGAGEATLQAQSEMQRIVSMPPSMDGVLCKRAVLLFALCKEPEVGALFHGIDVGRGEGNGGTTTYSRDMVDRVLPFITPRFLRNSCQAPDSYVTLALLLKELWAGERLGNFPIESE